LLAVDEFQGVQWRGTTAYKAAPHAPLPEILQCNIASVNGFQGGIAL
jgi:hypothetical protein